MAAVSAGMILVTLLCLASSRQAYGMDATESGPLFLSPLIQAGRIHEAQERSRVDNLTDDDVESYSGYFTVNETYSSNMFFWFFPAETNACDAPVLLWLNGGPGRSSLVGALMENGPFEVTMEGTLKRRTFSWTQHFSMLYVDNPVGVGYSFTRDDSGMSTSMADVAENLYSLLVQFFKLFPQYVMNDFYVGGQSYAGKYVPSLGCYIHDRNTATPPPEVFINFKGIYLGAGFCDAINMMPAFFDFAFNVGFISDNYRRTLHQKYTEKVNDFISGKKIPIIDFLIEFSGKPFAHFGRNVSADHLLGSQATNHHLFTPLQQFMRSPETQAALHVSHGVQDLVVNSFTVFSSLLPDFLIDTNDENAFLMENYRVLHYSGNLDVIVNVPMTEAFLDHVEWSGREEYRQSSRRQWHLNRNLAGWYTVVGNFTRVIVRNSGHMVPYDQPEAALVMMKKFISGDFFQV